jgi:hypothetical protein
MVDDSSEWQALLDVCFEDAGEEAPESDAVLKCPSMVNPADNMQSEAEVQVSEPQEEAEAERAEDEQDDECEDTSGVMTQLPPSDPDEHDEGHAAEEQVEDEVDGADVFEDPEDDSVADKAAGFDEGADNEDAIEHGSAAGEVIDLLDDDDDGDDGRGQLEQQTHKSKPKGKGRRKGDTWTDACRGHGRAVGKLSVKVPKGHGKGKAPHKPGNSLRTQQWHGRHISVDSPAAPISVDTASGLQRVNSVEIMSVKNKTLVGKSGGLIRAWQGPKQTGPKSVPLQRKPSQDGPIRIALGTTSSSSSAPCHHQISQSGPIRVQVGTKQGQGVPSVGLKRKLSGDQTPASLGNPKGLRDESGRMYDLKRVVVNFANVGASFGKKCLSREHRGLFDWDGVRKCVKQLTTEAKMTVVGVIYEDFQGTDNGAKNKHERVRMPTDIMKMCESVEETPKVSGQNHGSADDEMTIKCAFRRNCCFMDNDNYRDWIQQMRDEKCRAWLQSGRELLHLRYYFDSEGYFETIDGNVPAHMLVDASVKAKSLSKEQLAKAPRL